MVWGFGYLDWVRIDWGAVSVGEHQHPVSLNVSTFTRSNQQHRPRTPTDQLPPRARQPSQCAGGRAAAAPIRRHPGCRGGAAGALRCCVQLLFGWRSDGVVLLC